VRCFESGSDIQRLITTLLRSPLVSVCVLLDVGTDPAPTSIYHLWKTFDLKPNCGGACGEIVALKGKYWKNLLNPLVAAQNCELRCIANGINYLLNLFQQLSTSSAISWISLSSLLSGENGHMPVVYPHSLIVF